MSEKGNDGPQGGPPGDLLILIEEEEHKFLKREGNNLVFDLYVSFIDAALGTSLEVPTIDGKVKIKLEPGTQGGKILRLRGKGIVDLDGYNKGDQLGSSESVGSASGRCRCEARSPVSASRVGKRKLQL